MPKTLTLQTREKQQKKKKAKWTLMSLKLLLIGQAGSHMDSYKADLCSLCKALSITVHYHKHFIISGHSQ